MTKLPLRAPARCIKALLAMVLPPLLLPLFSREDNACSTNVDSSLTLLVHAICWTLKAFVSLDRPLPAGPVGGKEGEGNGSNNDGNAGSGGQELDHTPDWDGPPLPHLAAA